MRFRITIEGRTPIITHNGSSGLDTTSDWAREKQEIVRKKGANRTEADDRRLKELDTAVSIYWNADGTPTVPADIIRTVIEQGARKIRQGPLVREGLLVERVEAFDYDRERYGTTFEDLIVSTQFTVPVVVSRSRIMRTRAKFDDPWTVTFLVDCDDDLVDESQLLQWLDIAGRRVGIGDWRPAKSGRYGTFQVASIETID